MRIDQPFEKICEDHFDFLLEHGFTTAEIDVRKHGMWLVKTYSMPGCALNISYEWEGFVGFSFEMGDFSTTDIEKFFKHLHFDPPPIQRPVPQGRKRKKAFLTFDQVVDLMVLQLKAQVLPALRHAGFAV
jgi:hypothetical protein